MPSTYSSSLRVELQATGENDTLWGIKNNDNLSVVLESAIAGIATIVMLDMNYTLSLGYSDDDEARKAILMVTGANTAARDIIIPAVTKQYIVTNATSGGFVVNIHVAGQSGLAIAPGVTAILYCDATNMYMVASSVVPVNSVYPSNIVSGAKEWRFDSALGVGVAAVPVTNWGSLAIGGTSGGQASTYVNGVMGAQLAAIPTEGQLNSPILPLTFNVAGTQRMSISVLGIVNVPGSFAANSITSVTGYTGITSANITNALGYTPFRITGGTFTGDIAAPNINASTKVTTPVLAGGTMTGTSLVTTANVTVGGYMYSYGDVYSFSDERVKKNWRRVDNYVARLANVTCGVYDRIDVELTQVGVGAQSLQKILPEAINKDITGKLAVSYGQAAMYSAVELAKVVTSLMERVSQLEAELKAK